MLVSTDTENENRSVAITSNAFVILIDYLLKYSSYKYNLSAGSYLSVISLDMNLFLMHNNSRTRNYSEKNNV